MSVHPRRSDATRILAQSPHGSLVAEELFPLVYDELREIARVEMLCETPSHTLQPTALVHEAFVRLVGGAELKWDSRAHFFGAAARAMRQILVESARRRQAVKRGGGQQRMDINFADLAGEEAPCERVVALDEALTRLEEIDARKARIVSLRYFAGLTISETANALDISPTTVKDEWRFARAWLRRTMDS